MLISSKSICIARFNLLTPGEGRACWAWESLAAWWVWGAGTGTGPSTSTSTSTGGRREEGRARGHVPGRLAAVQGAGSLLLRAARAPRMIMYVKRKVYVTHIKGV